MKLHKLFLFAVVALATAFTSCSDDDSYTPGKPAGEYNIGFANEENQVLSLEDKTFDITLTRENAKGELSVPVTIIQGTGFTAPASATFKDGESTSTVTVTVPEDMKVCTDYSFSVSIPEEYTNPYKQGSYSPTCHITVVKEDYKVYASNANFTDNFWTGETWGVDVEYSEAMDMYRINDLFVEGYPLFFKWNKDTGKVNIVASDGSTPTNWITGLADDSYPSYYVTVANSLCAYNAEYKCIVFDFWWRVSAGSYGTGYPGYLYIE